MAYRYRKDYRNVAEAEMKLSYPRLHPTYNRGVGTERVNDRYKHSKPSYATPNPGYPSAHIDINELWQKPYIEPLQSVLVSLHQPYGSRRRVVAYAPTGNKLVVIQNPVGPIVPTDRGFKSAENTARMGTLQAELDSVSVGRRIRRRG